MSAELRRSNTGWLVADASSDKPPDETSNQTSCATPNVKPVGRQIGRMWSSSLLVASAYSGLWVVRLWRRALGVLQAL